MGCQRNLHAMLCLAAAVLLPTAASAEDMAPVPAMRFVSNTSAAKQFAILGVPSKLQAMAMAQAGISLPPIAVDAGGSDLNETIPQLPAPHASAPRRLSTKPDIFGTTALKVERTPLDGKWHRILSAGGAVGQWARLPRGIRAGDSLGKVVAVNKWVNAHLSFREDRQTWGTEDRWATLSESFARGRGDCEDYAIAKLQMLRAAGIAAGDIYLTIVKDVVRRADHAVLVVRVADRFLVLDSSTDRILESQDVRDYRPIFSYSARGTWIHGYRRQVEFASLEHVPVPATGH